MKTEIDLRSDTVTLPSPAMRERMARAEVGDDVYREDPTVNQLEVLAAGMLGMDAALFTTSGTMSNLLAMMAHCARGEKVLVGDRSDIWRWEAHGASVVGGLGYAPVPTAPNGELAIPDLEAAIDDETDPQCAIAGLVCLENTHGMCGGCPLSIDYLARARRFAERQRIPLHIDGARLFNAAIALKVPPRQIAAFADTVSFSLAKGLGCPVGSLLVGHRDVIDRARRLRKMIGGGMRQAGILAAAGVYALEHMVDRLEDDHATALQLADGLRRVPGLVLDPPLPETNIVFWRLADPQTPVADFIAVLREEGVRVIELGAGRIRAVTHDGITPEDISHAIVAVARAIDRVRASSVDAVPA
jgi:threonine aldolase